MRLAILACLILAGCQTAAIDAKVQQTLPQVCQYYSSYKLARLFITIPEKATAKVAKAEAVLDAECINPANETASSAALKALLALQAVQ